MKKRNVEKKAAVPDKPGSEEKRFEETIKHDKALHFLGRQEGCRMLHNNQLVKRPGSRKTSER